MSQLPLPLSLQALSLGSSQDWGERSLDPGHSTAPAQAQAPILCCCHIEPRHTAACRCRCHGVGIKLQSLHNCNCLSSLHTFLKYFF